MLLHGRGHLSREPSREIESIGVRARTMHAERGAACAAQRKKDTKQTRLRLQLDPKQSRLARGAISHQRTKKIRFQHIMERTTASISRVELYCLLFFTRA